jgi:hypothetical protein
LALLSETVMFYQEKKLTTNWLMLGAGTRQGFLNANPLVSIAIILSFE